ncbi:MAG: hypothetical protein KDB45_00725 [Mycobacterium sp.]|nr:hypothetical protein [Mycobacterium sp.]
MTTQTTAHAKRQASGPRRAGKAEITRRTTGLLLAALAAAVSVMAMLGSGIASADNPNDKWDGKTYGKAVAALSHYYTVVVASKVGDQVAIEDCVVISSERSHYTDGRGRKRSRDYLFHLNCQAGIASGKPGNSATSLIGQKTKKDQESARALQARLDKNPDTCNKSENSYNWCVRLCDRTKLCEVPSYSGS